MACTRSGSGSLLPPQSFFALQTAQRQSTAARPAFKPQHISLDTMDWHVFTFLPPSQPCLLDSLAGVTAVAFYPVPGRRASSLSRLWTEVLTILGPALARIKQICPWHSLDLCNSWRPRAVSFVPILLVRAQHSFCALAHCNVVWNSLSFPPLSDWALGQHTGAPDRSTLCAVLRLLPGSPSYQLGNDVTGPWLEESSPVPRHLQLS